MSNDQITPQRGRPRTMDPGAVLQVAMAAYWHEGPEVSVNAICNRAGISKPSLYREFGNEDGLTAAALGLYGELTLRQMGGPLSSGMSHTDKLDALISLAAENPATAQGCLFVKMRAARHHMGPKTKAKVDEVEAAMIGLFNRFLTQARATGAWSGCIPPDLAARYLHAQIGLALAQRARGEDSAQVRPLLDLALSVLRG